MRILILSFFFLSCARAPIKTLDQSMRLTTELTELQDDLEFTSLVAALQANVEFLRERLPSDHVFYFGPRQIAKDVYLRALDFLLREAKADASGARFRAGLKVYFEPYEVYGLDRWGEVFITSYFEPVIEGARKKSDRFTQPLYATPKDLVSIDLGSFVTARPALSELLSGSPLEQRSARNVLRGRLRQPENKDEIPMVEVFPDRIQIDGGALGKAAQVLAWVDPIDAFFLEIQGSGVVRFKNGKELKVGYAAQNGHPYVAIGKHLLDIIPLEKMSLQAIESHLRSLPLEEAEKIMQTNPSYVFFRPLTSSGITFLGTEVNSGRTIATDRAFFPKGALAYLQFEKPIFASDQDVEPTEWKPAGRFVLDQDTGGAIRGPHRVDLFWGRGPRAKQAAGVIKNKGRLIYFVPRPGASFE